MFEPSLQWTYHEMLRVVIPILWEVTVPILQRQKQPATASERHIPADHTALSLPKEVQSCIVDWPGPSS